jgi:hypothetical protein
MEHVAQNVDVGFVERDEFPIEPDVRLLHIRPRLLDERLADKMSL